MFEENKKSNNGFVIILLIVLVVICLIFFYVLNKQNMPENLPDNNQDNVSEVEDKKDTYASVDEYDVYRTVNGEEYLYTVKNNNKEYTGYELLFDDDNQLLVVKDDLKSIALLDLVGKKSNSDYDDYRCVAYSDGSMSLCDSSYFTIVEKNNKYYMFNIKDFKVINNTAYDSILYMIGDYFIVSLNNKSGILDKNGNAVIDIKYDYLGYSSELGILGVLNNRIVIFNHETFKEENFDYNKFTKISYELFDSYSYFDLVSSHIGQGDIKSSEFEKLFGFRYIGSEETTKDLYLFSGYSICHDEPTVYVIDKMGNVKIFNSDFTNSTKCN